MMPDVVTLRKPIGTGFLMGTVKSLLSNHPFKTTESDLLPSSGCHLRPPR